MKSIIIKLVAAKKAGAGYSHVAFDNEGRIVLIHDLKEIPVQKRYLLAQSKEEIEVFVVSTAKKCVNTVLLAENFETVKFEIEGKYKVKKDEAKKAIKKEKKSTKENISEKQQQLVESDKIAKWLANGWKIDTSRVILIKD